MSGVNPGRSCDYMDPRILISVTQFGEPETEIQQCVHFFGTSWMHVFK